MPIQRGPMPTLKGVKDQIEELEVRYGIATEDFVRQEGRVAEVDSDDGVEWLYLVEQARVLSEAAVEMMYSPQCKTGPLTNEPCSPDKLAA
jgi:hypothetical protein